MMLSGGDDRCCQECGAPSTLLSMAAGVKGRGRQSTNYREEWRGSNRYHHPTTLAFRRLVSVNKGGACASSTPSPLLIIRMMLKREGVQMLRC